MQNRHAGGHERPRPGAARDRDALRPQGLEERAPARGERDPRARRRRHEAQGGRRHPPVASPQARRTAQGAHVWQGRGGLRRGAQAEDLAPAGDPDREGEGDRPPHQGHEAQGAGRDPGGPGPRLGQEPRRPPEGDRAPEGARPRHRGPVHELPQRLTPERSPTMRRGGSRRPYNLAPLSSEEGGEAMQRLVSVLGGVVLVALGVSPGWGGTVAPLRVISPGSPFAPGCEGVPQPGSTVYQNAEVEPWVDVNPTDSRNLIAVWQQDRWSNGGAHGLVTAFTKDGGATWGIRTPHFSRCAGGTAANGGDYDRASDPWVTFAPNGDAYQISLSVNLFENFVTAILVSKSTDGGDHWSEPITLIRDTDPRFFNDKESMTADPTDAKFVYAVWDRINAPPGDVTRFL